MRSAGLDQNRFAAVTQPRHERLHVSLLERFAYISTLVTTADLTPFQHLQPGEPGVFP